MNTKNYAIRALIRLELRSRFADIRANSGRAIAKLVGGLLFFAAFYVLYIYLADSIIDSFYVYSKEKLFMTLFLTIIGVAFCASSVSSVVRELFFEGNNGMLMQFPVRATDVYIAKMTVQAIITLIGHTVAILPVLITYGVTVGDEPTAFWFLIPFVIIAMSALSFLVATVLAIPSMRLRTYMRDKFILTLAVTTVLVAAAFAVYMLAVQALFSYMQTEAMSFFSEGLLGKLFEWSVYFVPFSQLVDLLLLESVGKAILIILGELVLLGGAAYLIVSRFYLKVMTTNIEIEGSSFTKVTADIARPDFRSLLKKEFLEILRSMNYSFQYLAMSLSAPVMTYYCSSLAREVGNNMLSTSILGDAWVPALAMLVIMLFLTIIVSFSASAVSREGDTFYMTKITPVPYGLQVMVKFTLYTVVSAAVVVSSVLVLLLTGFLTPFRALTMLGICLLFAIALTCFAIKMDIVKPSFPIGSNELTGGTPNTFIVLLVGIVMSVGYAILGIVGSALYNTVITFSVIIGVMFLLTVAAALWLFIHLSRSYARIAPGR